jgi:hypothetical protein
MHRKFGIGNTPRWNADAEYIKLKMDRAVPMTTQERA